MTVIFRWRGGNGAGARNRSRQGGRYLAIPSGASLDPILLMIVHLHGCILVGNVEGVGDRVTDKVDNGDDLYQAHFPLEDNYYKNGQDQYSLHSSANNKERHCQAPCEHDHENES